LIVGTTHYAYGATLRASEDLGKTWHQIEKGPAYSAESGFKLNRIWQVEQHPAETKTVYAGVDEAGLFISRDGGDNWSEVDSLTKHPSRDKWQPGGGGLCLHTIVIDYSNPQRIWLGISAVGCFRTTDGGQSWTLCNNGLPNLATGSDDPSASHCVHKIVQHPTRPDTLLMQYHGGVFRSDDAADLWTPIDRGLPSNFGFPMVVTRSGEMCIVPLNGETTRGFIDGKSAVYRSTDEGKSWKPISTGLPTEPSHVGVLRDAMTVDEHDEPGIYFGTTMGQVYASRDGGESWSRLPGQLARVLSVRTFSI
jgi:photosystem II stability/assembly factor-like uncharacterized protein